MKDLKQVYIVPRDYEYNLRAAQLLAKLIECKCDFDYLSNDLITFDAVIRYSSEYQDVDIYAISYTTPITLEELEALDSREVRTDREIELNGLLYSAYKLGLERSMTWDKFIESKREEILSIITPPNNKLKVNPKDNTITIKKVKDSWTTNELLGNDEDSFDTFLLNSSLFSQEDRELVMEALSSWINQ